MSTAYKITKDFSPEFKFNAVRSGGAGGQNVNKVNTKVELRFNISDSDFLSDEQKNVLLVKLKEYINSEGEFVLVSKTERSQFTNKKICIDKFYALISKALTREKIRRASRPTFGSKMRRLESKKVQSQKKKMRRGNDFD
jgi:ribosome-associated protein